MRWLLVLGLAGLAACSSGAGEPRAERALPEPITISSPAFNAGAAIPQRFTCDGDNLSPPLRWSAVPAGTVEVGLVVDDPDAPRGTYVHWVLVGLNPASTELAEGAVPPGARQVRNSAGKAAYTGPCPPGGAPHHYRFTVYASSAGLRLALTPALKRRSRPSRRPPPPAADWSAPSAAERNLCRRLHLLLSTTARISGAATNRRAFAAFSDMEPRRDGGLLHAR